MFAYGSRIPSIDTDIMLSKGEAEAFRRHLKAEGKGDQEGPGKHIEILALDEPNELHGFDWELETVPAYTPSRLLADKLMDMTINLDDENIGAKVPSASALAFMKLKAMHDRCFDYQAVTDPVYMARINPSDRPLIARETASHYVRKAGKDLADVAFLCAECTDLVSALQEMPHLRPRLEDALEHVPAPIFDYAVGITRRHAATTEWIERHAKAT